MNSVTARFDTTVRQMTEMSQWPKCLSKNDWNVSLTKMSQQKITEISQRKKTGWTDKKSVRLSDLFYMWWSTSCYNIAVTATHMASKILIYLKAEKLLEISSNGKIT